MAAASRILVRNGTLITFGAPCRVLEGHDLLIEGDLIRSIAPAGGIPGPFDQVLDAAGKVVMPGLINAHMHFYSGSSRNTVGNRPLAGPRSTCFDLLHPRPSPFIPVEFTTEFAAHGVPRPRPRQLSSIFRRG